MTEETQPRRFWLKAGGLGLALVALSAATGWSAARYGGAAITSPDIAKVRQALRLRLPKTPIDAIDCKDLAGLCEVASKTTLFYVDHKAKYLVIGRIYDMEARQDLTAARLLALNPDLWRQVLPVVRMQAMTAQHRPVQHLPRCHFRGSIPKVRSIGGRQTAPRRSSFPISTAAIARNWRPN